MSPAGAALAAFASVAAAIGLTAVVPPDACAEPFAPGAHVTPKHVGAAEQATLVAEPGPENAEENGAPEAIAEPDEADTAGEGEEDDGDELSIVAIVLIAAAAASVLAAAIAYRAHRDD